MKAENLIVNVFFILLIISCSHEKGDKTQSYSQERIKMEKSAQELLSAARVQLKKGKSVEARATIKQMRKKYYLAISAREEAIILMDSIDLYDAKQDLAKIDSMMRLGVDSISQTDFDEACQKVLFYTRKLNHDIKQKK